MRCYAPHTYRTIITPLLAMNIVFLRYQLYSFYYDDQVLIFGIYFITQTHWNQYLAMGLFYTGAVSDGKTLFWIVLLNWYCIKNDLRKCHLDYGSPWKAGIKNTNYCAYHLRNCFSNKKTWYWNTCIPKIGKLSMLWNCPKLHANRW